MSNAIVTVQTSIDAPIEIVWNAWTSPENITQWNAASDDWHTPSAENDLQVGGKFKYRMEAKDGSVGFDFNGQYTEVKPNEGIVYKIADGRDVKITFQVIDDSVVVTETFGAESTHPVEAQRNGWQSILDRFKKHVEGLR